MVEEVFAIKLIFFGLRDQSVIRPPLQFHAALAPARTIPQTQRGSNHPASTRHTELLFMCLCRY